MIQEKKTDYFSIIGFVLMGGLLIWFLNQKETANPEVQKDKHSHSEISDSLNISKKNDIARLDSTKQKDTIIFDENKELKIGFSTKGGQISYLELKNYKTYKKTNLNLIDNNNSNFGISFDLNGKKLNTNDLIFSHSIENLADTCSKIIMTKVFDENSFIEFHYLLNTNSHLIDFKINSKGLNLTDINWNFTAHHTEKSLKNENVYTYLSYFSSEKNKVKDLSISGEDTKTTSLKWFSFKQQFFSTILVPENSLSNVSLSSKSLTETDSLHVKNFIVNIPTSQNSFNFKLYFLPNQLDILESYNEDFIELVPLGWGIFGWINKYFVIKVFNFLQNMELSMGLIILLLTILVKLIISPITYKNFVSSAKMKVLKPEIEAINEKFKNEDAMKKQQATMELYRKAGVNPLAGCIPAILQMPILIAMFRFFPSAIELRGKSFLWADDLSAYDSIWNFGFSIPFYGDHISLFTLLMAVALLVYTIMTGGGMEQPKQAGMPNMKVMMYLMPVMMIFWFNDYASGLSYYYFLSNAISILQMVVIKKYVIDEKKIHARIEENKKKDKPKGKLQKKLEELSKQSKKIKK